MKHLGRTAALLALALPLAAAPETASAQADFYKGKEISFIINDAAGTGYDQWARILGRHMGKYIPGNPTFVPQNMPGGGSTIAANYIYEIAPKDGTVIGMMGRNIFYFALTQPEKARFKPLEFNFIGNPEVVSRVCVAMAGREVQTAEDLFEKELLVPGTGAGSAATATATLFKNLLGMKFKIIEGYPSVPAGQLAMEQGEVDGLCQTINGLKTTRPGWLESGKVKVLFNTETTPLAEFDAPTIYKFAKTEEQRKIIGVYSSSVEFGRPVVAPPGVPSERVEILRTAFLKALEDPELKEEVAKQGYEITVVSGERLEGLVRDLMNTPKDLVAKIDSLIK